MDSFERLLGETVEELGERAGGSLDDERRDFDAAHPDTGNMLLGPLPPISDRAVDLIIAFEVTSEAVYEKRYRHPVWPGGNSGATIAIGFDAGYVTAAEFESNWQALLDAGAIAKMKGVCGLTGTKAQQALPSVSDVDVSFAAAHTVFRDVTLPRTTAKVAAALPGSSELSPDCLGALVSLVYNRGASFSLDGDRYQEMRAIKLDVANNNLADVPVQLRSMKRLWADQPNMAGLVRRRELEAVLFESGLP
ncbi:hypothetical protein PQR53_00375 [Paraburkholderia fungorum]|uniref:hypothetical protein n=1 Tax=Paraburkholderia fungorum TaxID=134537 RepID=UPI0038BA4B01